MKYHSYGNEAHLTSSPTQAGASAGPEFIRIGDVYSYCGIRRSLVYKWINEGLIQSICVRKKGAKTGVRLLHVESLRKFLLGNIEGGKK